MKLSSLTNIRKTRYSLIIISTILALESSNNAIKRPSQKGNSCPSAVYTALNNSRNVSQLIKRRIYFSEQPCSLFIDRPLRVARSVLSSSLYLRSARFFLSCSNKSILPFNSSCTRSLPATIGQSIDPSFTDKLYRHCYP